jgi:hypothetical protein
LSVTHPRIAPGQACLTLELFAVELPEKKVYLGGMSILSILLSLESGYWRMLVKSSLYGNVSKKPLMGILYPFSVGTLTCVKSIVMMCECACATVSEWFALADHFFSFGEDE